MFGERRAADVIVQEHRQSAQPLVELNSSRQIFPAEIRCHQHHRAVQVQRAGHAQAHRRDRVEGLTSLLGS